ncbi:hypothetical protein [Jeotgalicoccus sp. WY2]|nr:hypothetical protein [Jeotgalicoccus sp. WY2]
MSSQSQIHRSAEEIENQGFAERLDLKTNIIETDYMIESFNI